MITQSETLGRLGEPGTRSKDRVRDDEGSAQQVQRCAGAYIMGASNNDDDNIIELFVRSCVAWQTWMSQCSQDD
jgi:hypothetical protein